MSLRPKSVPRHERPPHEGAPPPETGRKRDDPAAAKPGAHAQEDADPAKRAEPRKPAHKSSPGGQSPSTAAAPGTGIGRQIHSTVGNAVSSAKHAGTAAHHTVDPADLASPTSDVKAVAGVARQAGGALFSGARTLIADAYHAIDHTGAGALSRFARSEASLPLGFRPPKGAPAPGKHTAGLAAAAEAAAEPRPASPAPHLDKSAGQER